MTTALMTITGGGDIIRRARRHRNLTQGQLAYITGIARETICRWECNRQTVSSDRLLEVLAKLDLEIQVIEKPRHD